SSASAKRSLMAALLTSTSTVPAAAAMRSSDSGTVMSTAAPWTSAPSSVRRRAASASHAPPSRSAATTVAPAAASARTCSRPSSPAAPVTMATLPASENGAAARSSGRGTAVASWNERLGRVVWQGLGLGLRLGVELRRAPEHRLDGLAAQERPHVAALDGGAEQRQHLAVGDEQPD